MTAPTTIDGAMMNLNQYFLIKIAEEASEVAQIALKAAHFGLSEIQPGRAETNAERVYAELNDLLAMVHRLGEVSGGEFWFDIGSPDHVAIATKLAKVEHYLAYSQSLGLVEVKP
jgi:NDP-sugar pyrophosphorylase family protein